MSTNQRPSEPNQPIGRSRSRPVMSEEAESEHAGLWTRLASFASVALGGVCDLVYWLANLALPVPWRLTCPEAFPTGLGKVGTSPDDSGWAAERACPKTCSSARNECDDCDGGASLLRGRRPSSPRSVHHLEPRTPDFSSPGSRQSAVEGSSSAESSSGRSGGGGCRVVLSEESVARQRSQQEAQHAELSKFLRGLSLEAHFGRLVGSGVDSLGDFSAANFVVRTLCWHHFRAFCYFCLLGCWSAILAHFAVSTRPFFFPNIQVCTCRLFNS